MMRLLCNGRPLDMAAGQKIQFKKENPLFAFDNLKCERTTEFSLPSTPTNDEIFEIAKRPELYGNAMRIRYDAELQAGAVVKHGFLYVSKYEAGQYTAVFVTGQLVNLQRLKSAGKISEITTFSDYVFADEDPTPANENVHMWQIVQYEQERGRLFPSAAVGEIVGACSRELGVSVDLTGTHDGLRYIPDVPHGMAAQEVTIRSAIYDTRQPVAYDPQHPLEPTTTYNTTIHTKAGLFGMFNAHVGYTFSGMGRSDLYLYNVRQFVPNINVRITFPRDFSRDLFLLYFPETGDPQFLGGYSFTRATNQPIVRTGDPLGGRTIEIPAGQPFILADCNDYVNTSGGGQYINGWRFGIGGVGLVFSYTLEMEAAEQDTPDGVAWLQDNLPDCTLVELLKTIAAASGLQLYYTEENGVTFDPVNVETWPLVELRDVLQFGGLTRTFGDYQQENVVRFDTAINVPESSKIRLSYHIENDNLNLEKELQVVPFSEGARGMSENNMRNANRYEDADKYTLAACEDFPNMQRVTLPANAGVRQLCYESTALQVTARLTLYEFERITPKTRLLVRGTAYVWTDAQWQDGAAVFSLAKI